MTFSTYRLPNGNTQLVYNHKVVGYIFNKKNDYRLNMKGVYWWRNDEVRFDGGCIQKSFDRKYKALSCALEVLFLYYNKIKDK